VYVSFFCFIFFSWVLAENPRKLIPIAKLLRILSRPIDPGKIKKIVAYKVDT
jgi:hypothetical protein